MLERSNGRIRCKIELPGAHLPGFQGKTRSPVRLLKVRGLCVGALSQVDDRPENRSHEAPAAEHGRRYDGERGLSAGHERLPQAHRACDDADRSRGRLPYRVVVRYAVDEGGKTAVEVDRIGGDGLREMQGVVTRVDRDAKRLSLRLADGSTETLQRSERAARHVGRDITRGAESTVIVYYLDEAGDSVAHFFKKIRED
jgi:hypothetical protein